MSHDHILSAVGSFPARELITQWLKAGYVDKGVFHDTPTGTGQGSVISPLLANVALHGMEEALGVTYDSEGFTRTSSRVLVRYADDWVVFCETKEDAEAVIGLLTDWLAQRGLRLSPEKTRIAHLTDGFDFLGFNVRLYQTRRRRSGYVLLIKPSTESVRKIRETLRHDWDHLHGHNVAAVIKRLNPVIRGWANYFRTEVASETFGDLDRFMFGREKRYAHKAHPRKPFAWRKARYWGKLNPKRSDTWVFGDKQTGAYLLKFRWFKIERHTLVRGTASPDDPALREYWAARYAARAKDLAPSYQKLARDQGYVCRECGDSLFNAEELHKHHKEPRARGGKDSYANLELTHLYCHQQIHAGKAEISKIIDIPAHEPTRSWLRTWFA